MAYLGALLIFAALAAACWFVSVAVYKGTFDGPDLAAAPHYRLTAGVAIAVTSMTSFIAFPGGYLAGLVVWAVAAFGGLGLSAGRGAVLFAYLAVGSFVTRLLVLGFMEMFGL
jgi:hypothetical protein